MVDVSLTTQNSDSQYHNLRKREARQTEGEPSRSRSVALGHEYRSRRRPTGTSRR